MRVLIVDLNNSASYPTLAIGYLTEPLRRAGMKTTVLSPLAHGMRPIRRDIQEGPINYLVNRFYFSTSRYVEWTHDPLRELVTKLKFKPNKKMKRALISYLDEHQVDIILVSAYIQYHNSVAAVAKLAHKRNIPVILGGPYFNQPKVAKKWLPIPGITAIFGGEADLVLPDLVRDVVNNQDLSNYSGLMSIDRMASNVPAAPLRDLDSLPIPDFDDFPWEKYPHRIIPLMTGRGCGWGACVFCSDIVSANGRTFRSRSLDSVLNEIQVQSKKYNTNDFIFLDIKLNSDLNVWHGIIDNIQSAAPGSRWVATVHVDSIGPNGLDRDTLVKAYEAGLRRVSFGLETASQRLNQLMGKGTSINKISEFLINAHNAGISVRTTTMLGYPGETTDDIYATTKFIREYLHCLDRVKMSKFKAIPGTAFDARITKHPERYTELLGFEWDYKNARSRYRYIPAEKKEYKKAKRQLLNLLYMVNSKPLKDIAQQFNGLM